MKENKRKVLPLVLASSIGRHSSPIQEENKIVRPASPLLSTLSAGKVQGKYSCADLSCSQHGTCPWPLTAVPHSQ